MSKGATPQCFANDIDAKVNVDIVNRLSYGKSRRAGETYTGGKKRTAVDRSSLKTEEMTAMLSQANELQ